MLLLTFIFKYYPKIVYELNLEVNATHDIMEKYP